MSPDRSESASIDAARVNLDEPWEVDYWVEIFGVGEVSLRRAVEEAGHSPADVRRYLAREASLDPPSRAH
jgi:predicted HTH domain antitoxin